VQHPLTPESDFSPSHALRGFCFIKGDGMANVENEFIQQTILFWEQYAGIRLSAQEAKEAVANMSGFFALLNEWEEREREADAKEPAGKEGQE